MRLQSVGNPGVQPEQTCRGQGPLQRLPHQVVAQSERARILGVVDEQPCQNGRLAGVEDRVGVDARHVREQIHLHGAPSHRDHGH